MVEPSPAPDRSAPLHASERRGVDPGEEPAARRLLGGLPGSEIATELALADWRRRIAELYGVVRRLAVDDPRAAWTLWCSVREGLYHRHPSSPIPADTRASFVARHFDHDPALRFEAVLQRDEARRQPQRGLSGEPVALPSSGPGLPPIERLGRVALEIGGARHELSVFWLAGYAGGLLLPFGDRTNGAETYGAGRYLLDTAKGADLGAGAAPGSIIIDFNFAFQPSCAFDARWACPLAPVENRLRVPIRAGEQRS
jgi:hypothetical protein